MPDVGDETTTPAVAVVLDVVESRAHEDQSMLLAGVAARVERVMLREGTAGSAGPSVGDEVQALYRGADGVGRAVHDVARLRLSLLVDPPVARPVDVRAGIGVGEVTGPGEAAAPGQSGSAWWRARAALDRASTQRNGWPTTRWWAEGAGAPLTAMLVALDTLLGGFDDDDRRAALGLLAGRTAASIADELGVVPSTLSARLHRHGVYGLVRAIETLAGTTTVVAAGVGDAPEPAAVVTGDGGDADAGAPT